LAEAVRPADQPRVARNSALAALKGLRYETATED